MNNLKETFGLRNNVDVLQNRESAFRYAEKCNKLHEVILGDNNQFWVVCFSDAQRLVKAGYETAK